MLEFEVLILQLYVHELEFLTLRYADVKQLYIYMNRLKRNKEE